MYPILLRVGPLTLHTYGLFVALAFILALSMMRREFDREGIPVHLVDSLALVLMVSGIFGARIFYFLLNEFDALKADPFMFFRIWEGGLVFYGGFLTAVLAAFIFSKKNEIAMLTLTDALAAPLLLGQAIGRIGCFFAGCCYGKMTECFLGVTFTHPESLALKFVKIHPTQLYSSLGDFVLFGIALFIGKKSPQKGILTAFYLLGYGVFRFFIEFLRGDDRGHFYRGFSPSQWIGFLMITAGISLAVYVKRNQES
jgi:phosphatidylglycerol:prolipoprotein diacylglycerol transferase